jgi:hypothetical protein
MNEDEKGGASIMQVRNMNCIQNFGQKLWKRDHSEDLRVDGEIKLDWTLGKWWETDCIHLGQEKDQRRALVKMVTELGFLKKQAAISWVSEY